jgi:glycosyltransferase involved in cell wall biosynthesis
MAKVTVCLQTYNRLEMLKESISSVLNTELDIELVVLNNACTDGTREYLLSLTDHRVTIMESGVNDTNAWLHLAAMATGEYVVLWSDDDAMIPGGLEVKVRMLDENPRLGMVFSRVLGLGPLGSCLGPLSMGNISDHDLLTGALDFRRIVLADYVPLLTAVMRQSVFVPFFLYLRDCPNILADWMLWIMAASRGVDAGYIASPTAYYRTHPGSETSRLQTSPENMRCHMNVWEHWAKQGYMPNDAELYVLQGLLLALAKNCGAPYLPAVQELTGYWR